MTFSRNTSFWIAAAVIAHTLWTSAAPAMTYPSYAAAWGLTTTVTTAIYAVFPIVVVAVLTLGGNLSDYIGRRNAMLAGVSASLIGVALTAVAPNVMWVFIGRALMGCGVGLSAGPATAAMVEYSPPERLNRVSSITTIAQAIGFAAAIFVDGALVQYAPFPLHLNFWFLGAVLVVLLYGVYCLPHNTVRVATGPWRPRLPIVPKEIRVVFAIGAVAVVNAFILGAIILSLGAKIAHDLVGSSNVFVNGIVLSFIALVWGSVALLAQHWHYRRTIPIGAFAALVSMGLLVLSVAAHDLLIFLCSVAAAGVGYSLLFMGGLGLTTTYVPDAKRAGTLSALYFIGYLLQGLTALVLGRLGTVLGLDRAIDLGAIFIGVVSVCVLAIGLRLKKLAVH
jgi:hypothetical protein